MRKLRVATARATIWTSWRTESIRPFYFLDGLVRIALYVEEADGVSIGDDGLAVVAFGRDCREMRAMDFRNAGLAPTRLAGTERAAGFRLAEVVVTCAAPGRDDLYVAA